MKDAETQRRLAGALGRIPSGLFILTARQGEAETGMLVSWAQQCSFEPLQISVALKRGRNVDDWLTVNAIFVLNILDDSETDMVAHFGRGFAAGEPAFEGLEVERTEDRPPVLTDTLAFLACRITARHNVGDHDLLIAEVTAGRVINDGHPMVHVRKSALHY